jgi:hypothetical protein
LLGAEALVLLVLERRVLPRWTMAGIALAFVIAGAVGSWYPCDADPCSRRLSSSQKRGSSCSFF